MVVKRTRFDARKKKNTRNYFTTMTKRDLAWQDIHNDVKKKNQQIKVSFYRSLLCSSDESKEMQCKSLI